MPPFATYSDLETRVGGTALSAADQTRATALLTEASNLVRQAAGQDIDLTTGDTYVTRGIYNEFLPLPQRPVLAVSSVSYQFIGGELTELDPTDYYVYGNGLVRRDAASSLSGRGSGWFGPECEVTVTYDHGYAEVPFLAKSITLDAVVRVWITTQVTQEVFQGPGMGMLELTKQERSDIRQEFVGSRRLRNMQLS